MKYFVHLKDGVVFAHHQSETEIDIPGDNIIEVQQDGSLYLSKAYVNGEFVDATEIKYAILDEENDNTVVGIEKTIFSSDAKGPIITDPNVKVLWKWNGSMFIEPNKPTVIPTIMVDNMPVTTTESIPAITKEELLANKDAHEAALATAVAEVEAFKQQAENEQNPPVQPE
jgi:glutamyl-tRNA reductase